MKLAKSSPTVTRKFKQAAWAEGSQSWEGGGHLAKNQMKKMTLTSEVMTMNPSRAHLRHGLVALVTSRRIRNTPIDALAACVEIDDTAWLSFLKIVSNLFHQAFYNLLYILILQPLGHM